MLGDQEVVSVSTYVNKYVPNFLATSHKIVRRSYTDIVVTIRLLAKFYPIFGMYALCTVEIGD